MGLQCEVCLGTDLMKKDNYFICQTCGMKYTLSEIRNLMKNSPIEVQGTVNINRNNEIENRFINAEREFKSGNFEKAMSGFSDILNIDPKNCRAIIFYAACIGHLSTCENNRINVACFQFQEAMKIAKGSMPPDSQELFAIIEKVSEEARTCSAELLNTAISEFHTIERKLDVHERKMQRHDDEMYHHLRATYIDDYFDFKEGMHETERLHKEFTMLLEDMSKFEEVIEECSKGIIDICCYIIDNIQGLEKYLHCLVKLISVIDDGGNIAIEELTDEYRTKKNTIDQVISKMKLTNFMSDAVIQNQSNTDMTSGNVPKSTTTFATSSDIDDVIKKVDEQLAEWERFFKKLNTENNEP